MRDYNPHDDEEPDKFDNRPFAPSYNKGRSGTRLEKAQRWDGVFSTMGGLMVAPILLMVFSLMENMGSPCHINSPICSPGFGWVNWLAVLLFPIYFSIMLYAQYMVHKQGFMCPGAPP